MSIRINNKSINYSATSLPRGYKASYSYFIRVNRPPTAGTDKFFEKETIQSISSYLTTGEIFTSFMTSDGIVPKHSFVYRSGETYHVASTFNSGVSKFYINGILGDTDPTTSKILRTSNNRIVFECDTSDISIQSPTIWDDYVLSQEEIISLRSGTHSKNIASGFISFYATSNGEIGLIPNNLSNGVANTAKSTISYPEEFVGGSEDLYYDEQLSYANPVELSYLRIGPSAKTLFIEYKLYGSPVQIDGILENPTLNVNGNDIILTGAVYGNSLTSICFPITGLTISSSDQVSFSASDRWVDLPTYRVPIHNDSPVDTTYIGGSFLPVITGEPITMKIGYNMQNISYYVNCWPYADILKLSNQFSYRSGPGTFTKDESNWITNIDADTYVEALFSLCSVENGNENNGRDGYPVTASGIYTLRYSGTGEAFVVGLSNTEITEIEKFKSGNYNYIKYDIYQPPTSSKYYTTMQLVATSGTIFDAKLYPWYCNENDFYDPRFISKISGAKSLRNMDMILTNNSNIVNPVNLPTKKIRSRSLNYNISSSTYSITGINPYNDEMGYFQTNGRFLTEILFGTEHNLSEGNIVTVDFNKSPRMSIPYNTTVSQAPSTNNILVPTNKSIAIDTYNGSTGSQVSGNQSMGGTVKFEVNMAVPYDEFIELCNYIGADPWLCIPHAATDETVAIIASGIKSTLNNGLKARIEYTNEHWNNGISFQQSFYCYGQGKKYGISDNAFYTKRAHEIHNIIKGVMSESGRENDIIRLFASQAANSSITSSIVNYAYANGIPIDEIAVAPYYSTTPHGSNFKRHYDLYDHEQIIDLTELSVQVNARSTATNSDGTYENCILKHLDILNGKFPNGKMVTYEGGFQFDLTGGYLNLDKDTRDARSRAFIKDPRIKNCIKYFLYKLQQNNVGLMNYFWLSGPYLNGFTLWPLYYSNHMLPGEGDGSDGLYDNRLDYDNLEKNVSVAGKAMQEWALAYVDIDQTDDIIDINTPSNSNSEIFIYYNPSEGISFSERNGVMTINSLNESNFGLYFNGLKFIRIRPGKNSRKHFYPSEQSDLP